MVEESKPKLTPSERAQKAAQARWTKMSKDERSEFSRKGALALHEKGLAGKFTSESAALAGKKAHEEGSAYKFTAEDSSNGGHALVNKLKADLGEDQFRKRMTDLASLPQDRAKLFKRSERSSRVAQGRIDDIEIEYLRDIAKEGGEVSAKKYSRTNFYSENGKKSQEARRLAKKALEEMILLGQ